MSLAQGLSPGLWCMDGPVDGMVASPGQVPSPGQAASPGLKPWVTGYGLCVPSYASRLWADQGSVELSYLPVGFRRDRVLGGFFFVDIHAYSRHFVYGHVAVFHRRTAGEYFQRFIIELHRLLDTKVPDRQINVGVRGMAHG
eukprot:Mycagemm_TRINITY_DN10018_c0_g1::TRINITY_DN10018_c0_g1_i2::g.2249::m.2249 type:complete len:142 gc:universal TRINITY_DN10018_c0_g1_i2:1285-860(-)